MKYIRYILLLAILTACKCPEPKVIKEPCPDIEKLKADSSRIIQNAKEDSVRIIENAEALGETEKARIIREGEIYNESEKQKIRAELIAARDSFALELYKRDTTIQAAEKEIIIKQGILLSRAELLDSIKDGKIYGNIFIIDTNLAEVSWDTISGMYYLKFK